MLCVTETTIRAHTYIYIYMCIYICIYKSWCAWGPVVILDCKTHEKPPHIYMYILESSARLERQEVYGIVLWDYITGLYYGMILRDNITG